MIIIKSLNNISEIKISCTDENNVPHTIIIDNFKNLEDFVINTYSNKIQDFKYINNMGYRYVDNIFGNVKLNVSFVCDGYNISIGNIKENIK